MLPVVRRSLFTKHGRIFTAARYNSTVPPSQSSHSTSTEANKQSSTPPLEEEPEGEEVSRPTRTGFISKYLQLSRPIEKLILRSRMTHDIDLARFLAKAACTSIYGILGISVLGTLGVDTNPIIAGIGITGFTVGFALKEIATNFLSGVLLVFSKPFQKGQYVKIMGPMANANMEGQVESIDARYVLLRTKERGLLLIPSVIVYTNPILVSKNGTSTIKK